VKQHLWSNYY